MSQKLHISAVDRRVIPVTLEPLRTNKSKGFFGFENFSPLFTVQAVDDDIFMGLLREEKLE